MTEFRRALATADLPQLTAPPGPMAMAPLEEMYPADEAPDGTLVYRVPEGMTATVTMIVCTSGSEGQTVEIRCYTGQLGPVPLFGRVPLEPGEWCEWTGSLPLQAGDEIRGSTPLGGPIVVAIYGSERT